MSLLTIAQDAAREVGFEPPNFIYGSTDATARQLLALANREGKILSRRHYWTILQKEHSFTTISGQDNYALPDDFDRFIDGTLWDRNSYRQMRGPLNPSEWQQFRSGLANAAGMERRFRVKRGTGVSNKLFIDPTPAVTGQNLVLEYNSTHWCRDEAGSNTRAAWENDSDEPLLPADLITLGVVWRFLMAKGLEYAAMAAEYEKEVNQAIARDGGMPTFNLGSDGGILLSMNNLPETGLGS